MVRQWAVIGCLLATTVTYANTPRVNPESIASRLHRSALEAYEKGRLDEATQLWTEAEGLHPSWKYAFNLASLLAHREAWLSAWQAIDRAHRYGTPEEHTETERALREQVENRLLATHAALRLEVEPSNAAVTLNGAPWAAPLHSWVPRDDSTITIAQLGYRTENLAWHHPVGQRHQRMVRLVVENADGALRLVGLRPGASVRIDGQLVAMPSSESALTLTPGTHLIAVSHPEFEDFETSIASVAGEITQLVVQMTPAQARSTLTARGIGAWSCLGLGAASLVAGSVLLGWAEKNAIEATDLNDTPGDLAAYDNTYDHLRANYDNAMLSGGVLMGLTAVMTAVSVTLFVLDHSAPEHEARSRDQVTQPRLQISLNGPGAALGGTF